MPNKSLATLDGAKNQILESLKTIAEGEEASYKHIWKIGQALCAIKDQRLAPHGEFDKLCRDTFKVNKSQRSDYMLFFRQFDRIEKARKWATNNKREDLDRNSLSGSLKLLKAFDSTDATGGVKRINVRKSYKELEQEHILLQENLTKLESRQSENQMRALSADVVLINTLYERWGGDSSASLDSLHAEISLLRLAASRRVSLQDMLEAHRLPAPEDDYFVQQLASQAIDDVSNIALGLTGENRDSAEAQTAESGDDRLVIAEHQAEFEGEKTCVEQPQDLPAVPVDQSITAGSLVCLVCGETFSRLKRHLQQMHQMTDEAYRTRFELPSDYPMTVPRPSIDRAA